MKIATTLLLASLIIAAAAQTVTINYGCKTYAKDGVTCTKCSQRYYMDGSGICQPVSSSCKTYDNSNGNCQTCYPGYFLADIICVFGTAPGSNTQYDPYCLNQANGVCTKCSRGFYLQNGTCTMVDTLCKTFDYSKLVCIACYSGFELKNGVCDIATANAADAGCAQFVNSVCKKCSKGYFSNQNKTCVQANSLCRSYEEINGLCTSCYAGFILSKGNCIADSSSDINPYCQKFQNQSCIKCSKGYYFDSLKICQQVDPLCKSYNQTNGYCTACYMGFGLVNNSCELSTNLGSDNDPNCRSFDSNNICLNCSKGYYFNSNKICTLIDPSCKKFDLEKLICTSCYSGYDLKDGNCFTSNQTTNLAVTCAEWLEGVCIKCAPRAYYNFDGDCVMVSDSCKTFNKKGQCTSCYPGYALSQNGSCYQSVSSSKCAATNPSGICIRCVNGTYLNSDSNCIDIDPLCSTFDYKLQKCSECYKGYIFSQLGTCQLAPIITATIPNCVQYDSNQKCLKCFNLYYLSNNTCVQVNPLCKTYDSSNGNCLSCFSVFTLKNGTCVLNS